MGTRGRAALIVGAIAVAVAIPIIGWAGVGVVTEGPVNHQLFLPASEASTHSTTWKDVPGLSHIGLCTDGPISVDVSIEADGAPLRLRTTLDEEALLPGTASFDPSPKSGGFAYTWETGVTGDVPATLDVQWKSPTGEKVTMDRGIVRALYRVCL